MTIEVRELSFCYGRKAALKQLNFDLTPGAFNALLGPNGAGKSTLFALLTRLYSLQQGEITISGDSIRRHPANVMRKLGVVFQQSTLDLDLTVGQNLHYHAALHGIGAAAARPRIAAELERLHMADRVNDKVRALNGGHRRRVEIARALLHWPQILLLDEPTVGLDPQARGELNQHIRKLCQTDGLTVLWATHLIEEVESLDPVMILHRGEILARGNAEDICSQTQQTLLSDAFQLLTGARSELNSGGASM